jgi:hypothetical protein
MPTIRKASYSDISLIRKLSLQVWPQTYAQLLTTQQVSYMLDLMYSESALHKQMEEKNHFIII